MQRRAEPVWNIGQVVKNKATGRKAVYCGFDMQRPRDSSMLFLTPEPTWGTSEEFDTIRQQGKPVLGEFVEALDCVGYYHGIIDLEKLTPAHNLLVGQICEENLNART